MSKFRYNGKQRRITNDKMTHVGVFGFFFETFKEVKTFRTARGTVRAVVDMVIELQLMKNLSTNEFAYIVDRTNDEFFIDSFRTYKKSPKKYQKEFDLLHEKLIEEYGE